MMNVVFHPMGNARRLFEKLNQSLGYTLDRCDYVAEFIDADQTVGISAITITPYAVYLDIYAPRFRLTRTVLNDYFRFVFNLRPHALAIVSSANDHCADFLTRLGFIQEGTLRHQFDGFNDECYFGFTDDEWRKSAWFHEK